MIGTNSAWWAVEKVRKTKDGRGGNSGRKTKTVVGKRKEKEERNGGC